MKTLDVPQMVEISSVLKENDFVKTLTLDCRLKAKPGQFVMLWIPGVDEKPFSLSKIAGKIEITFKKLGPFTEKLFNLKAGDKIGVRGPYGNGFRLAGSKICFISGGVGLAPLMPLILQAVSKKKNVAVIAGFKDKSQLLFQKKLSRLKVESYMVTDDGSYNQKAFSTDVLESLLACHGRQKFDQIYCCGPELMMKKTLDLCLKQKIPCQLSAERYMKCAVGLCGQCCLNGFRVCKDGPIFTEKQLEDTEFGEYTRNAEGRRTKLSW